MIFEIKLREFSIILEIFFQKSNTWITFENLIFLNFIWKKKDFYHNFGWKESWRKLMVSFENLILKRWHDPLFQDFFVESFWFWPWLFNFLRNDLTSRFLIFFLKKKIFFVKKFSFWKKKKRKKFYFFIDFLSNNPIHNLKGIIKFLEKMGFQLIGGEGGYGIFWYS